MTSVCGRDAEKPKSRLVHRWFRFLPWVKDQQSLYSPPPITHHKQTKGDAT